MVPAITFSVSACRDYKNLILNLQKITQDMAQYKLHNHEERLYVRAHIVFYQKTVFILTF
jgi:hypothetical protein